LRKTISGLALVVVDNGDVSVNGFYVNRSRKHPVLSNSKNNQKPITALPTTLALVRLKRTSNYSAWQKTSQLC